MKRKLFILSSALSLVLCAAMIALWARGHRLQEYVAMTYRGQSPAFGNYPGGLFLAWNSNTHGKNGLSYLGYRYGDDPLLGTHRIGRFAYRNDRYPPAAPGKPAICIRAVLFPTWVPLVVCGISAIGGFHLSRRLRPAKAGLCRACGYDLRASPLRCPECGARVPQRSVACEIDGHVKL